jgi:hypothetical protein
MCKYNLVNLTWIPALMAVTARAAEASPLAASHFPQYLGIEVIGTTAALCPP